MSFVDFLRRKNSFKKSSVRKICVNASTNWSSGSVQAADGHPRSIASSRLSAVSLTAVACPQSYWQFSHDRSKKKTQKGSA